MEILFLIVGLIFGFIGVYMIWDHIRFLGSSKTVTGTVVAMEKRTTDADKKRKKGGPIYYPVIKYVALGQTREFTSNYGMSMPQYDIGSTIPVAYSRKRDEARIRQKTPIIAGIIFAAIGFGLSVLFFNIFQFSYWSAGIAALVLVSIFSSARRKLKRHDISTVDEFREAFRNTNMKTSRGREPENSERISDKEHLQAEIFKTSKSLRWIGPIFAVVGLGIMALGIYLGKERAAFLEVALPADGEVVSMNSRNSDDGTVYYPVVRYLPPGSEQEITFEHEAGSNPPSYSVGEPVTVLYHPDYPDRAIIDAGWMNWFGPGLALILGLLFASVGIYSVYYWRSISTSKKLFHQNAY